MKYLCITEKSLDLLLITEMWLKERAEELVITELTPPGYTFSHRPRVSVRGGGIDFQQVHHSQDSACNRFSLLKI